ERVTSCTSASAPQKLGSPSIISGRCRNCIRVLLAWRERLPFQTALGALERPVNVVITGVTAAGVGLGQGQFVVDVGVAAAQAAPAGGAGAARLLLTEPALHRRYLRAGMVSNSAPARKTDSAGGSPPLSPRGRGAGGEGALPGKSQPPHPQPLSHE